MSGPTLVYIDHVNLQTLIDSGQYDLFKLMVESRGYRLATTDKIFFDLQQGKVSPEVRAWLKNPGDILRLPNPPGVDLSLPDAGEETLRVLYEQDILNPTPSELWTNDASAIRRWTSGQGTFPMDGVHQFGDSTFGNYTADGILNKLVRSPTNPGGVDPAQLLPMRDAIASVVPNNNNVRPGPGPEVGKPGAYNSFPTDAEVGYTATVRNGGTAIQYFPNGEVPPGYTTIADAMAKAGPEVTQIKEGIIDPLKTQINDVRTNPGSYDANGNLTAEAQANLARLNKVLVPATAVAVGVDLGRTIKNVQTMINEGRYSEIPGEIGGFLGRQAGGYVGAVPFGAILGEILGDVIGGAFGAWGGPIGIAAGMVIGGAIGAAFGNDLGHALGDGFGWLFGKTPPKGYSPDPSNKFGQYYTRRDPLVLDLNYDGARLLSVTASTVNFDLDGDGFAERTGWVSPSDGLLALDRNGNGIIDDGTELFGTAQQDGFSVLRALDTNGDNLISSADAAFGSLLVWQDANGDGISQATELTHLADRSIESIRLDATPVKEDRAGNPVQYTGSYTLTGGATREIIAVTFTTNQIATDYTLPEGFEYDPDVFKLPNLRGYGQVPDLWVAMTLDPVLKQMVIDLMATPVENLSQLSGETWITELGGVFGGPQFFHYTASAFDDMMARWAGVDISEGDEDGAQIGHTIEAFVNRQLLVPIANIQATPAYFEAFRQYTAGVAARFLAQRANLADNAATAGLAADLLAAGIFSGVPIDSTTLAAIAANLDDASELENPLSDYERSFGLFNFNFAQDTLTGDTRGFIDRLLADFTVDPDHPWAGYLAWTQDHQLELGLLDPDSSVLREAYRAKTGNTALSILIGPYQQVDGTAGADTLTGDSIGTATPDLLIGGAGDDLLQGGGGTDTYVFADGSGADTVSDSGGNGDEIAFQGSLESSIVRFAFAGAGRSDLLISFDDRDETVTVAGYFTSTGAATIEHITFPDGPEIDQRTIRDAVMSTLATDGDDTVTGFAAGSLIVGRDGDDTLFGLGGNDVLDGGDGNDLLSGGGGNDIYRVTWGGNADTIRDYSSFSNGWGGYDAIELGSGIRPEDLTVAEADNGHDLVITNTITGDALTIDETIVSSDQRIEELRFADGTVWTHADMMQRATAATAGADHFYGSYDGETISAGAGDDWIDARGGDDILVGGTGDDSLSGGGGNDVYRFAAGDGADTIQDYIDFASGWGGTDAVEFAEGIGADDITVSQSTDGRDLILTVTGTGDSVTLKDTVVDADSRIEQVRFSDGTIWTSADLMTRATAATGGADHFYGTYDGETLSGGAGDDWIDARGGNDVLIGGTGDDTLSGGGGNDTYRFAIGDGHDVIQEYTDFASGWGGTDTVEFAEGIAPGDLTVTQGNGGNDLILTITATGDSLTLRGTVTNGDNRIEQVRFADGTVWTADLLQQLGSGSSSGDDTLYGSGAAELLAGGAGNDWIDARGGDDIIVGGTGTDTLSGGGGNDIYQFARGDGADTIQDYIDWNSGWGGTDTIELAEGIAPGDIVVAQANGGNDLVLTIAGTSDSLTLKNTMTSSDNRIEQVRFADGTVWSHADLVTRSTAASSGDDGFYGTYDGDTLSAGAGNDAVDGRAGDDTLTGGTGNDWLSGGGGNDVYRYARGDGNDVVQDYSGWNSGWGGFDAIEFAAGITPDDVVVGRVNSDRDYVLYIDGGQGTITIPWAATHNSDYWIEEIRFADGTVWTGDSLDSRLVAASNGADVLAGTAGADSLRGLGGDDSLSGQGDDDVLAGDGGNDSLDGGSGNDTARFAGPSYQYTVVETAGGFTVIDTVAGRDGSDQLVGIESLQFADGSFDPATRLDDWTAVAVPEDAASGYAVGTFAAANAPGYSGSVTYSLADDADGRFAINGATGAVTYTGVGTVDSAAGTYAITVRATFGAYTVRDIAAQIAITDVAFAPSGLGFEVPMAPTSLVGSASLTGEGWYELTPNTGSQAGALWGTVDLSQDATWDAQIYLGWQDWGADGVSFGLQDASPTVVGMRGTLTEKSLGILWDTYSNPGEPNSDFSQFVLNGEMSTSFDPYHLYGNIEDANWHDVSIRWDADTSTISYRFDGVDIGSKTYPVSTLFDDLTKVYWGFGASSGGAYNEQAYSTVALRNAVAQLAVDENAAAGTLVGYLKGVDRDAGDTLSYAITDAAGVAVTDSNFEIVNGNQLRVKTGAAIDYETAEALDLHVKVTDSTGLSTVFAVAVAVRNLVDGNEAPSALQLRVDAATPMTLVGSASQTDPTTYQLTPNTGGQNGAMWGSVDLSHDTVWTTRMYFGGSDGGADGVSFALQNQSDTELGAGALTGNSIGIVFDTYVNSGEPNSDFSQLVLNGSPSDAFDVAHPHSNIEDNGWHDVVIRWDAGTSTLSYSLDGQEIASRRYDVVGEVFGGDPNGFFGFGARTGGAYNEQGVELVSVEQTVDRLSADSSAAEGTIVGLLQGVDPNGDALTYAITDASGTPLSDDWFEIANGREIRVKEGASLEALAGTEHDLFVKLSDPSGASLVSSIVIDVSGGMEMRQIASRIPAEPEPAAALTDGALAFAPVMWGGVAKVDFGREFRVADDAAAFEVAAFDGQDNSDWHSKSLADVLANASRLVEAASGSMPLVSFESDSATAWSMTDRENPAPFAHAGPAWPAAA